MSEPVISLPQPWASLLFTERYPHLLRVLPSRYQWDGWYASNNLVEQWNDAKRRRSSEVITKLREAAAAARSEGQ